ncbi:MAG: hypothetical protein ACRDRR_18290 [Pseudonocardiaceae bacterium]
MRRKQSRAAVAELAVDVPAELLDAGHPVWHDQTGYRRYMNGHGWRLPPSERRGVPASPGNRRRAAAAAWARGNGVATRTYGANGWPCADWRRLRELGLCR